MSVVVKLSYEEQILNALSRVERKRSDDAITRMNKEFVAIRKVLQPLYDELKDLNHYKINANAQIEENCKDIVALADALKPFAEFSECGIGFVIEDPDRNDHTCEECERVLTARKVLKGIAGYDQDS